MSKLEKITVVTRKSEKPATSKEERNHEAVIRHSREQYRSFLESINRSSDTDIDRAMRRA